MDVEDCPRTLAEPETRLNREEACQSSAAVPASGGASDSGADLCGVAAAARHRTGAIGVPSLSAAYSGVPKQQLPMATTTLNIVQRLEGSTVTTLVAAFLACEGGCR